MSAVPPGWCLQRRAAATLCVPRALAEPVQAAWFSSTRADAQPVQAGGRAAAWFVDGPHGPAVLRHYRRGGLRARLDREHYLWLGLARARPLVELRALAHLHAAGVAVPEPLGAAWWRRGPCYRAALLTGRIAQARPLAQALTPQALPVVRAAIDAMHAAGVWHADLNAYNILLDDLGRAWLIDFDRARIARGSLGARARRGNLLRLRRSLRKVAGDPGERWWQQLVAQGAGTMAAS